MMVPITLLFLVETLVVKGLMLSHAGSLSGPLDILKAARREMLWVAVVGFVLLVLASVGRRSARRWLSVMFAVVVAAALLALIGHFVLFLTTGIGITPEYLRNWLRNPSEVNRMILSEVRPVHVVLLFLQTGLVVFFLFMPGLKSIRRIAGRVTPELKRLAVAALALFFITLECGALLPPLGNVNQAINQFPALELVRGFFPEAEPESVPVEIDPEERLDAPLELELRPDAGRPNFVLILFESLSWKYSDVFRPGLGATPFLKKLGELGLVTDRLYTVVPHTSKALVSILGGIYPYLEPAVLEAEPGILPERTLPKLLRRSGYRTAFFQTANNYEERPAVVANLGFETFKGLFDMPQEGFSYVNYFGKEEMMMLGPSLAWVRENKSRPFFLTYLTLSSHHHYGVLPDFPVKDYGTGNPMLNEYLNAVRYTDGFIERVVRGFENLGLLENTVFIILGDHGESFDEHRADGHNYVMWEEGLRVPGIIYAPGLIKRPGRIAGFRSVLDIAPTVCEMAGLEVKRGRFVGTSLFSPPDEQRKLYFSGWSRARAVAVREGKTKYIFWGPQRELEVYDDIADPYEQKNLAGYVEKSLPVKGKYFEDVSGWADKVEGQYVEWRKACEEKKSAPAKLLRRLEASFGGLLSVHGFEFFPEEVQQGRAVWFRVGFRCEKPVKKPLRIVALLRPEAAGVKEIRLTMSPRVPLEKLKAGEYATAEIFISIPPKWPVGEADLFFGVLDEKTNEYLPDGGRRGSSPKENGLVRLGGVTVHEAE